MPITLNVKSIIIDKINATDSTIAAEINANVTYNTIHGFSIIPISDTLCKIIVVYS